jgi:uncharacterized protein (UPF0264 family)
MTGLNGDREAVEKLVDAALASLEANRARIDDLNVYPVPDGDTGTNLTMTVRAVADAVGVGGDRVSVIAAAYADADALDPPALAPACLPALVDRTGIAGALVDTFVKDGRGLYGWLSEPELTDFIARTHTAGASFAVAGQLTRGDLCRVAADVVGVRSAVCHGGDRAAELDADLVAAAVAALNPG